MASGDDSGGAGAGAGATASPGKGVERTFLTALRDRDGGKGGSASKVQAPESMDRVLDLHKRINLVVGNLNEKVGLVLQKQEKEFLAAYRAHMLSVQKELQQLRAKANEAELAMKKNEKIRSLEEERNWYRKEALRLDKFATAMKKDLKYMTEKLESIEDDRNWLERQLKSAKKSNKLLRAELELRMMQGGGGGSDQDGGYDDGAGGGVDGSGSARSPMFPPPGRPSNNAAAAGGARASSRGGARSKSRGGDRDGRDLGATGGSLRSYRGGAGAGGGAGAVGGGSSLLGDEELRSDQYRALVERLESQLAAERRTVKQLRAAAVADSSQRADMEEFFLRCIDDVKRDVARRRTKANTRAQKTRAGANPLLRAGATGSPVGATHASFDKDFATDTVAARAEDPGLTDFTATDRRKVIRKLLEDDYVLQMLHSLIFAGAPEQDPTQPPDGADRACVGSPTAYGGGGGGGLDASGGVALDPAVSRYLQSAGGGGGGAGGK